MRALRTSLLAAAMCLVIPASAGAAGVRPKSAGAFHDSVGVSTHIVYYSTSYGNWPLLVDRLEALGVHHLRDGTYANPGRQWAKWNERYYRSVEYAADHGMRFLFGLGSPGYQAGTLDQLIDLVAGRLRRATEALEQPNEFDKYVGGRAWPSALAAYDRELYRKVKANASLRSLPVVGPSIVEPDGPRRVGNQSAWLDRGNIHPYTGGASPNPLWIAADRQRMAPLSGRKPVWATEAGFHNALNATTGFPPTSEQAAAIYVVRTLLEHFKAGIARTYLYELVDLYPDPGRTSPNWNFGLLRADYSPKPAYTALKNLLGLVGEGQARTRPLRMGLAGNRGDARSLVLQKADGSYVVALWRLASVWDRERRRPLRVRARPVVVRLPGARRVELADPVVSDRSRPLRLRRSRVRVALDGRPLLLHVIPRGVSASR